VGRAGLLEHPNQRRLVTRFLLDHARLEPWLWLLAAVLLAVVAGWLVAMAA